MFRLSSVRVLQFIMFCLLASTISAQSITQQYPLGKIFLSNGMTIEGKELRMTMESATINIMGQDQVYSLDEIVQVMAKQGKGKKFGQNCAGTCAGFYIGLWLASGGTGLDENGNEYDISPGQYLLETALWSSVSYGIGFLVGRVADDWEVVYLKR